MKTNNQSGRVTALIVILALVFLIGALIIAAVSRKKISSLVQPSGEISTENISRDLATLKKFKSEEEFKKYLSRSASTFSFTLGGRGGGPVEALSESDQAALPKSSMPQGTGALLEAPSRFSETNIQVAGIDEPDIVKTDGKEIYFSTNKRFDSVIKPKSDQVGIIPPPRERSIVKNIRAFPVDDLELDAEIAKGGELLLEGNILVVVPQKYYYYGSEERKIFGYDVSNPSAPKEKWSAELKGKAQIEAVRLYGDKIYAVMSHAVDRNRPCPIEIMSVGGVTHLAKCMDIYHPETLVPVDVTYSVNVIDAGSGKLEDTLSFVGSSSDSVVYMSEKSLYVTYYYPGDFIRFALDFFKENKDLVSEQVIRDFEGLESYQIGANAKTTEYYDILERHFAGMDSDEEMRIKNELSNRMDGYFEKHKRDLERTGIVKIGIRNLDLEASGTVTGKPLNQFSLDEYNDNLRVAMTVGSNWWWFGFGDGGARQSANDIYVLDEDLRLRGELTDLGLEERIYSARFIEDKGYVVTFKQVDPFYVLDLSDPMNPEKKGELKIPGYSSYLHPIAKNKILGIGEENNKVKVSLFDVSDPADPTELAKYNLDEYYSEVSQTHHAFLLDKKHQIFFLPGSKGGYIFSYAGDNLSLAKTISETAVKRAIYLSDYLYVIGEDKLIVLNEKDWERVGELEL